MILSCIAFACCILFIINFAGVWVLHHKLLKYAGMAALSPFQVPHAYKLVAYQKWRNINYTIYIVLCQKIIISNQWMFFLFTLITNKGWNQQTLVKSTCWFRSNRVQCCKYSHQPTFSDVIKVWLHPDNLELLHLT